MRPIARSAFLLTLCLSGCVNAINLSSGCDGGPTACGCAADSDCGATAPRCNPATKMCVPCLPQNDNCTGGSKCFPDGAGSYRCAMNCISASDCLFPGPNIACCNSECVDLTSSAGNCKSCGNACAAPANGTAGCTNSMCGIGACTEGFADCNNNSFDGCEVNTNSDARNCGACGASCAAAPNAGSSCQSGKCGYTCSPGYADCNGLPADGCEVATGSDNKNCGGCNLLCSGLPNATATCVAGACTVGNCAANYFDCNHQNQDGCEVNSQNDLNNCGACGVVCAALQNAVIACAKGFCGIGSCNMGYADCNGVTADGCEVALNTDANHCGTCGQVCLGANSNEACMAGTCAITSCTKGYADCDKNPADGCESYLATDVSNCGGCGNVCAVVANGAAGCANSTCGIASCNAGYADCDKNPANGCEENIGADVTNCGGCGTACAVANDVPACKLGVCAIASCNTGYTDCDGLAANGCETATVSDAKNCGTCGHACAGANSTQACSAGKCAITSCAQGDADCDLNPANGCEVAIVTDTNNCGGCGKVCAVVANASTACTNGACGIGACTFGYADCDKNFADGCEANLLTPQTCGSCANTCAVPANATAGCKAGTCGIGMCVGLWGDCNMSAADGCEKSLAADISNCGACGMVCSYANAAAQCLNGVCGMGACNAGYADCDKNAANGCEVNTNTDADHCGGCGTVCAPATPKCQNGTCTAVQALVGSFVTDNGTLWSDDPPCYTCQQACALLFGGAAAQYSCSTTNASITHTAFITEWGVSGCQVHAENYDLNTFYDCGTAGCAESAYVDDTNCVATNYCWK